MEPKQETMEFEKLLKDYNITVSSKHPNQDDVSIIISYFNRKLYLAIEAHDRMLAEKVRELHTWEMPISSWKSEYVVERSEVLALLK